MNRNKAQIAVDTFIMIVMFLAVTWVVTPAQAKEAEQWKEIKRGYIYDLSPMYHNGLGLMIEFKSADGSMNGWATRWGDVWVGNWPSEGQYGILYDSSDGKRSKWERVEAPKVKKKITKVENVVSTSIAPAPTVESVWVKADKLPEAEKVVVIKFDDDTTSTAYVNLLREWKLDINRSSYKGGKTIENIKVWKDVGL